jgi:hypothetical protein
MRKFCEMSTTIQVIDGGEMENFRSFDLKLRTFEGLVNEFPKYLCFNDS